ncbi:NAD(P)/FAD-dependent oxidoreductase [Azospirillum picis]|uniref:D-arginine dehydrogenase n=1 Tax=Azospirillum picis TaxID=488438 RepID=A0ABU0MTU1_9PROT|nr:FAD-dependent oxidoreductase [Azospirillum picis]MBP2303156.1 D-arginine dehydrogenase [Azospirillum picis]MDQ0536908.1 D-arginine dehydrogenase [Azospirillum picis]
MERVDFLVVGAGIAGASAAYELAAKGTVLVLERESQPGYHSTGRSAALYTQTYGPAPIRALTVASWDFYTRPPAGFAEHPLLTPRGVLIIGRDHEAARLDEEFEQGRRLTPSVERWDRARVLDRAPFLRADYAVGGVWEPDARDIDVHALHQGYLRGLKARGGRVATDAEVRALAHRDGLWIADTTAGSFAAPVVVNAAGAWADELARLAGVATVGLVPKRRTAITFDPVFADPADKAGLDGWPMVTDIAETFYVKPDAGRLLASPADQTPVAPCDVQPEDIDVAETVDRLEQAARFTVRRLAHRWAGLRSFVADKVPVVGFSPDAEGFFWLAGQGGYGIQTAPAMGRVAAGLATGAGLPDDVRSLGLSEADLSPARKR